MWQCCWDGVEVDQFDGGFIGFGEFMGYLLLVELQKFVLMVECFYLVGYIWILFGDYDVYFVIWVCLGLVGI